MTIHNIDHIPFSFDAQLLCRGLRVKPGSRHAGRLDELAHQAQDLARPKAAYVVPEPPVVDVEMVAIEGVGFKSRLLSDNLKHTRALFPFLATCGREIESWARQLTNPMEAFWADTLMTLALAEAVKALEQRLAPECGTHPLSCMNPGSLADWPLTEQRPLFELMGAAPATMGMDLSPECLITPLKSVSGIYFLAEDQFINCRLCPREHCPGRRAPRDAP
jgi:hypothetical protein